MDHYEFVISTPADLASLITYDNAIRQTHGVLIDMFKSSEKYIVISSPYLRNIESSNSILNRALKNAMKRGVDISILSTRSSLAEINIRQYASKQPVNLYVTKTNFLKENEIGSHAKFCVVDGNQLYMGSANFTFSGLNKHFEMGIFARGSLAKQVEAYWLYLRDNGHIVPYLFN